MVAGVLAAWLVCGPAVAQEGALSDETSTSGEGTDDEARGLFQAGSVAYEQGRFENALAYFRQAYALSGRAVLLYNIAMAAERLRRDDEALEAFRAYLEATPDAPQRASIEARIAVIEQAHAAPASLDTASAPPPSEPDVAGPLGLMVGGGIAGVGFAIVLGLAAADVAAVEGAPRGATWASVEEAYERSRPLSIAGAVGLGLAVVTAAAGAVWLALQPSPSRPSVAIGLGPGALSLRGSWP